MNHIELAFYRGEGRLFDRLIRLWTRSRFSHCEIVLRREGGQALLFSASPRDGGVRKVWRVLDPSRWECVTVRGHGLDALSLATFIGKTVGAKYDWAGIFGSQLFAAGFQKQKRWFCSEICAEVLGLPEPQRYSPEALRKMVLFLNGKGRRDEG